MIPGLGLQIRLGALFLLVALIPYSIVMAFAFHLDGPTARAVGICVGTLIPTAVIAFLLGNLLAREIYRKGAQQMKLYQAESGRAAQLAELNRLRTNFVSAASHELRTPLGSLIVFMDGLIDNWDRLPDGERRAIALRMQTVGRRLHRLVSDLLLSSEIEAGAVPIYPEDVAFEPIAQQARDEIAAGRTTVPISLSGPRCRVWADSIRVQQILVNLLDNATKFAVHGSIVSVTWTCTEGVVSVSVHNVGPRVPAAELDALFLPFHRVTLEQKSVPGSGLGLHICQRLAHAMGGTLSAQTTEDGMTFTFSLLGGLESRPAMSHAG